MHSNLSEGLKKLYSGKEIVYKQITLFSVLGILSIVTAYLYLGKSNFFTLKSYEIWIVAILEFIWTFYFIGYETKFINNAFYDNDDILPEMDRTSLKIMRHKFPIILFIINAIVILASVTTHKENILFFITLILSTVLTLFQIGFAQNYADKDVFNVFKVFQAKDYFDIFVKKILINLVMFLASYGIVFVIILIGGLTVLLTGFVNTRSFVEIITAAQSSQLALTKLSIYAVTVISNYLLVIGNFAWNYDVVKLFINRSKQS